MAIAVGNCRSRRAAEGRRLECAELFKVFYAAAAGTRGSLSENMETVNYFFG
jgi:hypothetical protein